MTPEEEKKNRQRIYHREYQRERRRKTIRICPDCKIRTLEKGYMYCSECGYIRTKINNDIADSKVRHTKKYIDYHRNYMIKYNADRREQREKTENEKNSNAAN